MRFPWLHIELAAADMQVYCLLQLLARQRNSKIGARASMMCLLLCEVLSKNMQLQVLLMQALLHWS